MKTKTIDTIVRESLLDKGLPLHFYTRHLHHALRIYDELALDFPMGNVKTIELSITSYNRAVLPSDYIDFVSVNAKNGERLVGLERVRNLNKQYNYDDSGNKIPYPTATPIGIYEEMSTLLLSGGRTVNFRGEQTGRLYGRTRKPQLIFDIDEVNQEIVFGNMIEGLTKVTLIYITSGASTSIANTVTPYATDVIIKYIDWMALKAMGGRLGDIQLAEQAYHNAKRILRSRLHGMDRAEILGAIRNGIHGTIKN